MDRKVRTQITGMFPNLMSEEKIAVKNGVLQNHRVLQNHGVLRSAAKLEFLKIENQKPFPVCR